jgi:hypothetical protein
MEGKQVSRSLMEGGVDQNEALGDPSDIPAELGGRKGN